MIKAVGNQARGFNVYQFLTAKCPSEAQFKLQKGILSI